MNADTFSEAVREAQRFINLARRLEISITTNGGDWDWPFCGTPETGAVKRASMDLSRALSAMRKAN